MPVSDEVDEDTNAESQQQSALAIVTGLHEPERLGETKVRSHIVCLIMSTS